METLTRSAFESAVNELIEAAQPAAPMAQDQPPTRGQNRAPELNAAVIDQLRQAHSDGRSDAAVVMGQDGDYEVASLPDALRALETAESEQRFSLTRTVNQLDGAMGMSIPWGSILFGAVPGIVVGEVVDGFASPRDADGSISWTNVVVKGGVAIFAANQLPRWMGRPATNLFVATLGLQVAATVLPLNEWIANAVGWFGGLTGNMGNMRQSGALLPRAAVRQEQVFTHDAVTEGVL